MSAQLLGPGNALLPALNRITGLLCTFFMAAVASWALTLGAFTEALRSTRVAATLVVLIGLHLLWHRRFLWRRELSIYTCFFLYMCVSLLWTRDLDLAMNTLVPAANFILILMLFSSFVSFHNVWAVLMGALAGFAAGAVLYTMTQGFPFTYPVDFSYNAIAGMYLFGLFLVLLYSSFGNSRALLFATAGIIMLHIVATTSIKTNLGILLGVIAGATMYFRFFLRLVRRNFLTLLILLCLMGFAIATNDSLLDSMNRGVDRVLLGVEVLQSREDRPGYSAFAERSNWRELGIEGWTQNPIVGHGTESFRGDYGMTSHSTPIDLMYNFGVIGLALFYSVFASLTVRVLRSRDLRLRNQRPLILGGITCYVFISLSGTMHYNAFLAVFVGISVALLSAESVAAALGRPTMEAR